jgi:outer membrane protease
VEYLYGTGYSEGVRSSHSNDFNIKAGPSIFFNSSVALEVTLGYQYTETTFLNSGSSSSQIENNNLILGVGLQIHLEK